MQHEPTFVVFLAIPRRREPFGRLRSCLFDAASSKRSPPAARTFAEGDTRRASAYQSRAVGMTRCGVCLPPAEAVVGGPGVAGRSWASWVGGRAQAAAHRTRLTALAQRFFVRLHFLQAHHHVPQCEVGRVQLTPCSCCLTATGCAGGNGRRSPRATRPAFPGLRGRCHGCQLSNMDPAAGFSSEVTGVGFWEVGGRVFWQRLVAPGRAHLSISLGDWPR